MHPYPHRYHVQATGAVEGAVRVTAPSVGTIDTFPPPEFDGPEGHWSPETLFVGAIADCYILSFRAVARASKLEWTDLSVDVEGVLDKSDTGLRFTGYTLRARLVVPGADRETLAQTVLQKAKRACLVTNSLNAECALETSIVVGEPAAA